MGSPANGGFQEIDTETGRKLLQAMLGGTGQIANTVAQNMPSPQSSQNAYTTAQGNNFNFTQPNSAYAGRYTEPMNINAPRAAAPAPAPAQTSPEFVLPMNRPTGLAASAIAGQIQQQAPTTKDSETSNFDNPAPLPNYRMYIPPEMMPNINAYLQSPNSLLGEMQNAGIPSAGAGRFSNLLSTLSKGK